MHNLAEFEKKLNIKFKDRDLLEQVFVHRSYLNENPNFKLDHNERLEFLGDAVLELIVTEYLYKHYDNAEGELTNWRSALVKGDTLSELSHKIDLEEYLLLSRGEQKCNGKSRQLILANTLEALIGAIYLDQGFETSQKFIGKYLIQPKLKHIIENKLYIDAKSHLQEVIQEKMSVTPNYSVIHESGPDHNKMFVCGVYINRDLFSQGEGSSKNEAEQSAARHALEKLGL